MHPDPNGPSPEDEAERLWKNVIDTSEEVGIDAPAPDEQHPPQFPRPFDRTLFQALINCAKLEYKRAAPVAAAGNVSPGPSAKGPVEKNPLYIHLVESGKYFRRAVAEARSHLSQGE